MNRSIVVTVLALSAAAACSGAKDKAADSAAAAAAAAPAPAMHLFHRQGTLGMAFDEGIVHAPNLGVLRQKFGHAQRVVILPLHPHRHRSLPHRPPRSASLRRPREIRRATTSPSF